MLEKMFYLLAVVAIMSFDYEEMSLLLITLCKYPNNSNEYFLMVTQTTLRYLLLELSLDTWKDSKEKFAHRRPSFWLIP